MLNNILKQQLKKNKLIIIIINCCWPLLIFKLLIFCLLIIPENFAEHFLHDDYFDLIKKDYPNRTYKPKYYWITISIRNHNITEAIFFRLIGVDNTVDFYVSPGQIFTNNYNINRKGAWTLFIEFPGDRYAKSQRKMISRDSYPHWVMEVYSFPPDSVGFSDWHKLQKSKTEKNKNRKQRGRRKGKKYINK